MAAFDTGGHRRGHFQSLVRFAEVIISEIESHRSLKVFKLLAESVRESSKTAAMHTERMILLFNVRRGNAIHIGHTGHNSLFNADNLCRAVTDMGTRN